MGWIGELFVLSRVLFSRLFLELRNNQENKHQNNNGVSTQTLACHDSIYIILFLTRCNESINDEDDLHSPILCSIRSVYVLHNWLRNAYWDLRRVQLL